MSTTTPSAGIGHSTSSPPAVLRGAEHLGPPSILQQIESMIGTLEGDNCPSISVDRPDNLSELWLYVIQESLLQLRARGRFGPPRTEIPSRSPLFPQSAQVPTGIQDMLQMPRSPGIEVEAAPRPSLVTPSHSPSQHEPSPPLEFHLRQTTPTDVPNSVSTTTTDTTTVTLFSTEVCS